MFDFNSEKQTAIHFIIGQTVWEFARKFGSFLIVFYAAVFQGGPYYFVIVFDLKYYDVI